MFRARGIDKVSIAEIMNAAGLTTGGFYNHFSSKNALIKEAAAMAFDQVGDAWRDSPAALDASVGRKPELEALVHGYLLDDIPEKRCPMLAFASTPISTEELDEVREVYGDGAYSIYESVKTSYRLSRKEDDEDLLVLFSALVGYKLIAESIDDAEWKLALRTAIINAAKSLASNSN